jgi:hypothetical protein
MKFSGSILLVDDEAHIRKFISFLSNEIVDGRRETEEVVFLLDFDRQALKVLIGVWFLVEHYFADDVEDVVVQVGAAVVFNAAQFFFEFHV